MRPPTTARAHRFTPTTLARAVALCAAPALVLLAAPVAVPAQQPLAFEIRGGVGLPAFDLADRVDAGPAVGLDLSYAVAPRVSVVVGGDLELLDGEGEAPLDPSGPVAADLNAWHYGAGLEAQLLDPARTYWRLSAGAGVGGSTFDVAEGGGSETDLSVYGGLELGWDASQEVDVFVGLRTWVAFAGDGGVVAGEADTLWSFPLTGGLRLTF